MDKIGANKYKCFIFQSKNSYFNDMKKIITLLAFSFLALSFIACDSGKQNYVGYWMGESNMIFEVLTENQKDYTIRNVNGDLSATIRDGALRGKNSLDMEYSMKVKGDSAYYEFGSITTGYKRISKDEYDRIFATLQKVTIE